MARKFIFGGSYTSFAFETETIAYMTALGIANDSTIYYPSTPQQITGNGIWIGIDNVFKSAKSQGWFSKIKLLYMPIFASLARNKFNALNPLDTDGAFRLTFFGGWTQGFGIMPNGLNGYANTHFVPSANITFNSEHICLVSNTNNTPLATDSVDFGSFSATGKSSMTLKGGAGKNLLGSRMNNDYISTSNTNANGTFIATKNGTNTLRIYKGITNVVSGANNGALSTFPDYLGSLNIFNQQPVYTPGFTNQNYIFITRGSGLSATDVTNMNTTIANYKIHFNL